MKVDFVHPEEFQKLIEVWEASVRATHHFLTEADIAQFKPLILKEYFFLVNLRCVRDEDGKILGFSGVADDKLEMLFLRPEARGKGIGKLLMNHAIAEFNISKVDVNEQNPDAVGFYQRMGFKTISRSELDPQGKPFPILHMELRKN